MFVPSSLVGFVLHIGIGLMGVCFGVDAQQDDVPGQNQANDENRPPQRRRQGMFQTILMKILLPLGFRVHAALRMHQNP